MKQNRGVTLVNSPMHQDAVEGVGNNGSVREGMVLFAACAEPVSALGCGGTG